MSTSLERRQRGAVAAFAATRIPTWVNLILALLAAAASGLSLASAAAAQVQIRGTLLVTEIDSGPGKPSRQVFTLERLDGRRQPVEIARGAALTGRGVPRAGDREDQLRALSGAQVQLTATNSAPGAAVSQVQVLAAGNTAPPNGPQKVLTILAKFPGDSAEALSVEEARRMVYTGEGSASDYWREASDGRVTFVGVKRPDGDVTPWIELAGQRPDECRGAVSERWRGLAIDAAKKLGFDFAADGYDKLLLVLNKPSGCGGVFGEAAYFGDTVYDYRPYVQTVAHEFGHSFGLTHAQSQSCRLGSVRVSEQPNATCASSSSTDVEYGDFNGVVGHGFRELSAAHKTQLGFMPAENTKTWAGESVVTLTPSGVAQAPGTTQQLKIPLSDGTAYQLETRRPQGTIDDYAAEDPVVRGVLVRQVTQTGSQIDTKLVTTSADDVDWVLPGADNPEAPIEMGRSYYDARYDLTIETLTVTPTATTVRIQRGPKAGAAAQVTLASGELAIVDTVGRANDIVYHEEGTTTLVVDQAGPLLAPAGCTQVAANQISCPSAAIDRIRLDLHSGDDVARLDNTNKPATILGGDGNDVLAGNMGTGLVDGGAGDDVLFPNSQPGDVSRCGAGSDRYDPAEGHGTFDPDCEAPRVPTVSLSPIWNAIEINGTPRADRLEATSDGAVGTVSSDRGLSAGEGCALQSNGTARCSGHMLETRITGREGDDILTTRGSARGLLSGHSGDDTLSGGSAFDYIDGGDGNDTASYADRTTAVRLTPQNGVASAQLSGGAIGTPERDRVMSAERVVGGSAGDELASGDAAQTLEGGLGNDLLEGGGGADVLIGGDGDDAVLARGGAVDTVDCGAGVDRTMSDTTDSRLGCETEALAQARVVNGVLEFTTAPGLSSTLTVSETAADYRATSLSTQPIIAGSGCVRTSNNGVNCPKADVSSALLDGGDGNDTLRVTANLRAKLLGGSGTDSLFGGPAADRLDGGAGADAISGGAGADTVDYSASTAGVSVTFGDSADDGTAGEGDNVAADVEGALGSPYDDTIRSTTSDETLDGAGGSDTLTFAIGTATAGVTIDLAATARQPTGPAGADQIAGFERVVGTANADTLYGTSGQDVLSGGPGGDLVWAGEGSDIVRGDDGDDTIVTVDDAAADTVDCGAGADRTVAGSDDTRTACETAAAASVEVSGSEVRVVASPGIPNGLTLVEYNGYYRVSGLTGQAVIAGRACTVTSNNGAQCDRAGVVRAHVSAGDENDNVKVTWPIGTNISGGAGDDTLTGGAGNETLNGGDGNDTIDGGLGENYIYGDDGNDRLVQSAKIGSDLLSGGPGVDEVDYSAATTPLTVNLDDSWNDGSAGEEDNVQTDVETQIGGSAGDTLTGAAGSQTLDGRGGNDVLNLRDGGDDIGRCGDGNDQVLADLSPKDADLTACETVTRG